MLSHAVLFSLTSRKGTLAHFFLSALEMGDNSSQAPNQAWYYTTWKRNLGIFIFCFPRLRRTFALANHDTMEQVLYLINIWAAVFLFFVLLYEKIK